MKIFLLAGFALLLVSPSHAVNLLVNGDFEDEILMGWESDLYGTGAIVDRATTYHPDEDYEARAYKPTGIGHSILSQTVALPSLEADFSVSAYLNASATSTAWAAAAISVAYLDEIGTTLGETRIYVVTHYCPWEPAEDLHLISGSTGMWDAYSFNIEEELANLPAVDAQEVRAVKVSLLTDVYDC